MRSFHRGHMGQCNLRVNRNRPGQCTQLFQRDEIHYRPLHSATAAEMLKWKRAMAARGTGRENGADVRNVRQRETQ